jgi:NAD(P)-dependent dehydrogenase (short-subunit alcohol dehydrogenase family)
MDLSLNLENTHVLITGGSGFLGSSTVTALVSAGARVTSLDLRVPSSPPQSPNFQHLSCNISSEWDLTNAFSIASEKFGPVSCCIALASLDLSVLPHHESLADMDVDQWRHTQRINVEGTFLTARTWLRALRDCAKTDKRDELRNVGLIIVGSESGHFGKRGNADYAAGKSAVQIGLVKSLMADVSRIWPRARVNAVAPGPVDTEQFRKECSDNPEQLYLDAQAT